MNPVELIAREAAATDYSLLDAKSVIQSHPGLTDEARRIICNLLTHMYQKGVCVGYGRCASELYEDIRGQTPR